MENNTRKNQYGLLSMISMIVGTVIGSGIYVKNNSLITETHSPILATIGWLLGGLLVLSILVAMLEVASATTKKNEQGTLGSWSRYFWGPNLSKFISAYFMFVYFPLIIASEAIFAADQLFQSTLFPNQAIAFFVISLLSILILVIIFFITSLFVRPGKIITSAGTIIKLLPLLMISLIMFLILFGATIGQASELNPIFDPNNPINSGINDSKNNISQVLLILPAILFSFDGFLYSASLSTESKSPNTFKFAAIISIFFITMIYIVFSLSTFALANTSSSPEEGAYTIGSIILNVFPNGQWLVTTTSIIISLSIITAVFGYATSSMWTLADMSNTNEMVDKNGYMIRRNKSGNPYRAGFMVLILSIIGIIFMRSIDLAAIILTNAQTGKNVYAYVGMTDFISNLYSVLNFVFYTIIIVGGLVNRFTKKVDVDKSKLFFPGAAIAIIGMSFVVGAMTYDIFTNLIDGFSSGDPNKSIEASLQLLSIIMIGSSIVSVFFYLKYSFKKQDKSVWDKKRKYQNAYNNHMSFEDYVKKIK